MLVKIEPSWGKVLESEFDKPYFVRLTQFVRQEYASHTCYPPGGKIFNAFALCPFDHTKVVILGQDPYHDAHQAEGLCFSVSEGVTHPPSLVNIFKEVQADTGAPYPQSGSLQRWARQGVLLLNATLTVREHAPGSHQRQGWETFTDEVIRTIATHLQHIVFILWGSYARSKRTLIDPSRHLILESVHPSPLSANRGGWFGNHHFSLCNRYLADHHIAPIVW